MDIDTIREKAEQNISVSFILKKKILLDESEDINNLSIEYNVFALQVIQLETFIKQDNKDKKDIIMN